MSGTRAFRWSALAGGALLGALGGALWLWLGAGSSDERPGQADVPLASSPLPVGAEPSPSAFLRATVWVEVVSEEGEPVAGAKVTLKTVVGAREQRSDESGLSSFEGLLPGPYALEVAAAGYRPLTTSEVLPAGVAEAAWSLRLLVDPTSVGALRGVVWSEGAPVAGALVTTLSDGQARHEGAVLSDADGRFVLPRAEGAQAVLAFHAAHGVGERPLAEERELVLELPRPGFVEGRVTDDKGQPLASFRVQARVSGLPQGLARALVEAHGGGRDGNRVARRQLTGAWVDFPRADDDESEPGAFRVGPVAAGLVRVVASAEGRAPAEREAGVPAGGVARDLILSLPGPLVVSGCVTDDESGQPVRGARVHAMRTDAPSAPGFGFATTDDEGCYRLLTAAGVRHSVGVRARGYVATHVGGVIGRPDDEVQRDFRLERASGKRGQGFRYVGIGAKLSPHDKGARVLEVFTSGSAAGVLSPGDVVLRVDGVWTQNTSLARIVEMIVGEEGTDVELVVQPKEGGPVKTVILSRREQSSSG